MGCNVSTQLAERVDNLKVSGAGHCQVNNSMPNNSLLSLKVPVYDPTTIMLGMGTPSVLILYWSLSFRLLSISRLPYRIPRLCTIIETLRSGV